MTSRSIRGGANAGKALFLATRALKDTPRWALATRDADARSAALIAGFDCAIGATLGEAKTPTLGIMPYRVLSDVEVAFRTAKAEVKRLRPPVGNDLRIWVARS
jgi:acid phosphatase (class A)